MKKNIFLLFMFVCFGLLQSKAQTEDIAQYDNVIFVSNTTAGAGDELDLSIQMNNEKDVCAFEFNLYLPDGVSPVEVTDYGTQKIDAKLTTARTNSTRHSLSVKQQGDYYKVLCYSSSKYKFANKEGEVMTIRIKLSDNLPEGAYAIIIKNEVISFKDNDNTSITIPLVESTLTVSNSILGDVNGDKLVNIADLACLISYLNGDTPAKFVESAANVDGKGTIDKDDVTALSNIILDR